MLQPAILHVDALNEAYQKTIYNPDYKYLVESVWKYHITIDDSDEYRIQLVSVGKSGEIVGYLEAATNRINNVVTNIEIVSFDIGNRVFGIDVHRFITKLTTTFGFRKVSFEAICGSLGETIYDKHLHRYNGRIVGTLKKEVKLNDGKYHDVKLYELFP